MSRIAEINIIAKRNMTKEKVMNKLSWRDSYRDPKTNELVEIEYEDEGGEIQFWYNPQVKRMIPFVIDHYKPLLKNTFGKIENFVNKLSFQHEIIETTNNVGMQIKLEEKLLKKDFEDSLDEIESTLGSSSFCTYEVSIYEDN